jgi:hypothetical protein
MEDTNTFLSVYKDLDCKLLYNPTRKEVIDMLTRNPEETTLCFGHGTPNGLFTKDFKGYVIDNNMAHLLRNREVIGIWCYAKEYARKHKLKGFFTGMFVSNQCEAECHNFKGHDDDFILEQDKIFSDRINKLLVDKIPLTEWVDLLNEQADKSIDFIKFNYSALTYYNGK